MTFLNTFEFSQIFMKVFQIKDIIQQIKEILSLINIKHLIIFLDDFSEIEESSLKRFVDVVLAPLNNWSEEFVKFKIAAYYTLASCSIIREDLPVTQSLPAYPIPITLLARIAIDTTHQGKGLGSKVLITA